MRHAWNFVISFQLLGGDPLWESQADTGLQDRRLDVLESFDVGQPPATALCLHASAVQEGTGRVRARFFCIFCKHSTEFSIRSCMEAKPLKLQHAAYSDKT